MTSTENYAILRNNSKTFYLASSFLPARVRYKVLNVYAFCRKYDDSADSQVKVENPDVDKIIADLKIDEEVIKQLKLGIDSDREFKRIENIGDLLIYSYRVAGCVGLMMCELLNINNKNGKYFAIDLGIAMQITNICRDVFEDLAMDRVYIPREMITEILIENDEQKKKLFKSIKELIALSEKYYESAVRGIREIPVGSRFSILMSLRLYQAIGRKISKNETKYFKQRIHTTRFDKFQILIKCLLEFCIYHLFGKNNNIHNPDLHHHLKKLPFTNEKI